MAHSMTLEIMSPEKTLFQGLVTSLRVPSKIGSISILRDHAPIVSLLETGTIFFSDAADNKQEIKIKGGILKAEKNQIVILSNS